MARAGGPDLRLRALLLVFERVDLARDRRGLLVRVLAAQHLNLLVGLEADEAAQLALARDERGVGPAPHVGARLAQHVERAARARPLVRGERGGLKSLGRAQPREQHEEVDVELVRALRGGEERRAQLRARHVAAQRLDDAERLFDPSPRAVEVAPRAREPRQFEERGGLAPPVPDAAAERQRLHQSLVRFRPLVERPVSLPDGDERRRLALQVAEVVPELRDPLEVRERLARPPPCGVNLAHPGERVRLGVEVADGAAERQRRLEVRERTRVVANRSEDGAEAVERAPLAAPVADLAPDLKRARVVVERLLVFAEQGVDRGDGVERVCLARAVADRSPQREREAERGERLLALAD